MAELLEVIAHGVTAILATWLGLLVLTRAGRAIGSRIFSLVCFLLVTWCVAIIVQRFGTNASVFPAVNVAEDAAAFFLVPATAHIAFVIALEGRRSTLGTTVLVLGYALAGIASIQAAVDPSHPIAFAEPYFAPLGIPGPIVAWAFAAARAAVWATGIGFLIVGLREAGPDRTRRRQLTVAVATVTLGVLGGMLRILPEEIGGPRWLGVSVIAISTVAAAYAVLSQHIFVAAEVAERAVRWSALAGLGVVAYVAVLVGLEGATSELLGIDLPIVTALALVVTLALFDPVSERVRQMIAGNEAEAARVRLVQAIGGDPLLSQDPERSMEPALERVVRTFRLSGAEVVSDGRTYARVGDVDHDDPRSLRIGFAMGDRAGHTTFGRKRNGLTFTPADRAALEAAVDYLGSSMQLAERQEAQASALAGLRAERHEVESRGAALTESLVDAASPERGLVVHALGSLRAERDGEPLRRWGGEKAGSRQAEGIFAFLLDRGERGAGKDEIIELVWPDVDLDRADVAFHRTMLGLRSMLQPGWRRREGTAAIVFHNDRYRLDAGVIAWSDVAEFERLLAEARGATPVAGIQALEQGRRLYRGDYLDDCPFYGDSADVEDRRVALRRRYVDLLVELGERHAERGDRPAAAECFRDAQAHADDELPHVVEALAKLMLPRGVEPASSRTT